MTLESDIDASIEQLIQLIQNYADSNKPMDLAQKLQFLTLDIISTIGFGQCFGLLEEDDDPSEYVKSTATGLKMVNRQMAFGTWWMNWLPLVGPKTDANPKTSQGFDRMLALSSIIADTREHAFQEQNKSGPVQREDMLASFTRHGLLGDELKTEMVLQIVAGSDTTAGAMRGTGIQDTSGGDRQDSV